MKATGMVDIINKISPEKNHIPTFSRGRRRINVILVSSSLYPSFIDAPHTDINEYVDTDHIGITATIDTLQFCNRISSQSIKTRITVTITNPNNIIKYNQHVLKMVKCQGLHTKLERLKRNLHNNTTSLHLVREFNNIDGQICCIQKKAEKRLRVHVSHSHGLPKYVT